MKLLLLLVAIPQSLPETIQWIHRAPEAERLWTDFRRQQSLLQLQTARLFGPRWEGQILWSPDERRQTLIAGNLFTLTGSLTQGSLLFRKPGHQGDEFQLRFSESRIFRQQGFQGTGLQYINEFTLRYQIPVARPQRRILRLQAEEFSLQARLAYLTYHRNLQQLALRIAQTYLDYLLQRAQRTAQESALEQARWIVARARHREAIGAGTQLEVLFAERRLREEEMRLRQIESQLALSRALLARTLGIPIPEDYAPPWPSEQDFPPPKDQETLLRWLQQGPLLQEIRVRRALLALQDRRLRATEEAQVLFFSEWSFQGIATNYEQAWERLRSAGWRVGVTVSHTPGLAAARKQQLQEEWRFLDALYRETERNLEREALQLWTALQSARADLRDMETILRAARETLENAKARYEVGMATVLDVLQGQRELREAELRRWEAQHRFWVAVARVYANAGKLIAPRTYNGKGPLDEEETQ